MKRKNLLPAILFFCLMMLACYNTDANSIAISNVIITGQNITNQYSMVNFDISWENSWRNDIAGTGNTAPNNWDAAWVFVKYRVNSGPWQHAWLDSAGHIMAAGTHLATGLLDPASPFNPTANPGLGVFIYRDTNGTGTFSTTGVQLRWNYGANGVDDNGVIDIRVYAIEMVYVPQDSFFLGSGGFESSAFYKYPSSSSPFQVTGEGEITVGTATDNLYYDYTPDGGDQLGPVPVAFPKGYAAFYCMKYEISQQGYVDFLNSLSQIQATKRKHNGSTNRYAITGTSPGSYHTTSPYVACNNLNWADLAAYFDWSGLRPITEFEYEKSCRGPLPAVPNEFAWGTAEIASNSYTLIWTGNSKENIGSHYSTTAGNAAYEATTPFGGSINGPVRVGIFAGNSLNSGRVTAGATYYGIMEMTGNLLEHFITAGNPTGRSFTGMHGNGTLTTTGDANVTDWPGISSLGAGFRGGYWYVPELYLMVSERSGAAGTDANRYHSDGGRGGRTEPSL
jgi:hypothetical protein